MDNELLKQLKADLPDKTCLITIMFEPTDDQQAIDLKTAIDKALGDIETRRYSFSLEQRNRPVNKANGTQV